MNPDRPHGRYIKILHAINRPNICKKNNDRINKLIQELTLNCYQEKNFLYLRQEGKNYLRRKNVRIVLRIAVLSKFV